LPYVTRDFLHNARVAGSSVNGVPGLDAAYQGQPAQAGLEAFQRLFAPAMVFLDSPDHPRLRKAMAAGFHPSWIRDLRPEVERLTDELLEGLDGQTDFDFIKEVARPLPSRVIALLSGIDRRDEDRFMAWSDDLAAFIGALQPSTGNCEQPSRASCTGALFRGITASATTRTRR
jgi:cytochrome P450